MPSLSSTALLTLSFSQPCRFLYHSSPSAIEDPGIRDLGHRRVAYLVEAGHNRHEVDLAAVAGHDLACLKDIGLDVALLGHGLDERRACKEVGCPTRHQELVNKELQVKFSGAQLKFKQRSSAVM